ncbi:MAG: endolytic transglycosylase MltG [Hyphomonadaceae bacterium]
MARVRPVDGRRRRSGGGFFGTLLMLAALGLAVAAIAAFVFLNEATRAGPNTADTAFVVERGSSVSGIGAALEAQGLIRDARLFRVGNLVFARDETLQAGEYNIPAGASVQDIIEMMAGGAALQHAITFREGITIREVMRVIEESDVLTGDVPEAPPEGSILPETYHVQRGMTRAALLQQMRDARDQAVAEIWEGRQPGLPLSSPDDLVNLASIVERETGVPSERPLVAAVFLNRLRVPMRLETDPTIIYGVCLRHPERCRDGRLVDAQGNRRTIRQSEIALDTGYNTYRIDGLPPTPIANPGRAALEATAHPAQTNALFFVADGTGGHIFAATITEHNANVARWRRIEAQRLAEERAN